MRPTAVRYSLPDRRVITVPYDVCRGAATLDFQRADGRIVMAVILPGER